MDILSSFAERLKELMFDGGDSVEQLSAKLNTNKSDLYHWLQQGNRYMPCVTKLIAIADYYHCRLEFLIGISEDNDTNVFENSLPNFGERFKTVVAEKEYNLYKLGRETSTSTGTYYRWINGESMPNIESLLKIANVLDCTLDYLIGREK